MAEVKQKTVEGAVLGTSYIPYHNIGKNGRRFSLEQKSRGKVDGECQGVGEMGTLTATSTVPSGRLVKCSNCHIQLPV